jgi:hypothetical protein
MFLSSNMGSKPDIYRKYAREKKEVVQRRIRIKVLIWTERRFTLTSGSLARRGRIFILSIAGKPPEFPQTRLTQQMA